jgi:hypothetical protein
MLPKHSFLVRRPLTALWIIERLRASWPTVDKDTTLNTTHHLRPRHLDLWKSGSENMEYH